MQSGNPTYATMELSCLTQTSSFLKEVNLIKLIIVANTSWHNCLCFLQVIKRNVVQSKKSRSGHISNNKSCLRGNICHLQRLKLKVDFYRPSMKLWEGNVFTGLCLFTGGISGSMSLPGGYVHRMGMSGGWWACLEVDISKGGGYVLEGWVPTPPPPGNGIQRDMVDMRTIRILLECLFVLRGSYPANGFHCDALFVTLVWIQKMN